MGSDGRISQCFAFLAEGRFDEAVSITRQGLNGHPDASRVLGQLSRVASLLGGCLALWLTVSASDVRFDFYREGALDADRRGDRETAIVYHEKADRYAP